MIMSKQRDSLDDIMTKKAGTYDATGTDAHHVTERKALPNRTRSPWRRK